MEFLQRLWEAVEPAALTVASALIIALLGYALAWAKAQLARLQNDRLRELVGKLVQAAEQKLGADQGKAKYRWVARELAERGILVDPADIEAEVYWLNQHMPRVMGLTPLDPGPKEAA